MKWLVFLILHTAVNEEEGRGREEREGDERGGEGEEREGGGRESMQIS